MWYSTHARARATGVHDTWEECAGDGDSWVRHLGSFDSAAEAHNYVRQRRAMALATTVVSLALVAVVQYCGRGGPRDGVVVAVTINTETGELDPNFVYE